MRYTFDALIIQITENNLPIGGQGFLIYRIAVILRRSVRVEGRGHDEESHEQRQADENEIGRSALDAKARSQKRQRRTRASIISAKALTS